MFVITLNNKKNAVQITTDNGKTIIIMWKPSKRIGIVADKDTKLEWIYLAPKDDGQKT